MGYSKVKVRGPLQRDIELNNSIRKRLSECYNDLNKMASSKHKDVVKMKIKEADMWLLDQKEELNNRKP